MDIEKQQERASGATSSAQKPVVFLIGGIPPPVGGITIHIQRLTSILCRAGFEVEVFDTTGSGESLEDAEQGIRVWRGPQWRTMARLVSRIMIVRPAVVHWHVSDLRRAGLLLTPMRLIARIVPTFVTVHSGNFPSRFRSATKAFRARFAALCRSATAIIGVNDAIVSAINELRDVRPEAVHMIPAYLPQAVPITSGKQVRPGKVVAIVCGFGTALYGWHSLKDALSNPDIAEWHWVFYTVFDESYMADVIALAEGVAPGKVRVHRSLSPSDFQTLLISADVLLRPTQTDGDSLVVREALSVGVSVVASDAVSRPSGCRVFRTGNSADLATKLRDEIESPSRTKCPQPDFGTPLLRLYEATAITDSISSVSRERQRVA
jgi:glycosyltransferase involved in cell wall biosynthesis